MICKAAAFLAGALLATQVVAQDPERPPSKRQVGELVQSYLAPRASQADRANAIARLKLANPALATNTLRSALRDDAIRARALELAIDIGSGGLWTTAKRYIDGPDEDIIVRYGLALSEPGADTDVSQRWLASDSSSTSYSIANAELRRWPIGISSIRKIRDSLDNSEDVKKHDDAVDILSFQLGASLRTAAQVRSQWERLIQEFEIDARAFRIEGDDLMREKLWEQTGSITRVGPNFRLGAGAWMELPAPSTWNDGELTVIVRVRPISGSGTSIGLGTEQGTWRVQYEDGKWVVRSGREIEYFLSKKQPGWSTIKFAVRDDNQVNTRLSRRCDIYVDDERLMTNGELNGEFRHIQISTGDSSAVVGGINSRRSR